MAFLLAVGCSRHSDRAPEPAPDEGALRAAYEAKQWGKCTELATALAATTSGEAVSNWLYTAACCLALDGKRDRAFAMLDRSVAAGWRDVELTKTDPDLASLRGDPRWPPVVSATDAKQAAWERSLRQPALRRELLALMKEDQGARTEMIAHPDDPASRARVQASDEKTTARMKEVIATYGWPGKTMVASDGAIAAFVMVQHADRDLAFQKQCLPLVEQAYKAGEAFGEHYALLYDRIAVAEHRPQRYGSQFDGGEPSPIEDEAHVDERRKSVGLSTMAEYRAQMQETYGPKQ